MIQDSLPIQSELASVWACFQQYQNNFFITNSFCSLMWLYEARSLHGLGELGEDFWVNRTGCHLQTKRLWLLQPQPHQPLPWGWGNGHWSHSADSSGREGGPLYQNLLGKEFQRNLHCGCNEHNGSPWRQQEMCKGPWV